MLLLRSLYAIVTPFDSNNFVYIYIYGYVTFAPESIKILVE